MTSIERELKVLSPKSPRSFIPAFFASIAWPRFPTSASFTPWSNMRLSISYTAAASLSAMTRGSTATGIVPCSANGRSRSSFSVIRVRGT